MSGHEHHHDHDHDGHGSMPVYQFLGNILGYPLDETLLYNVSDPAFWVGLRDGLENERTHEALNHVEAAVAKLAEVPEDHRKMTMDAEYAQTFLLPDAPMSPLESAYGLGGGAIYDVARELGVETSIQRFLPDDHIANELFMLVPLDYLQQPSDEQLKTLAAFFEEHPLALLRRMLDGDRAAQEGTGFYRAIVELALAWLQWDLDAFEGN
ncbi:MAG: molecular chaperone TorD family protein [Coriobacteriales bacterium]